MSGRILPGASQALALHMKAPPAGAGRAVKPRSRKAVREAQGRSDRGVRDIAVVAAEGHRLDLLAFDVAPDRVAPRRSVVT